MKKVAVYQPKKGSVTTVTLSREKCPDAVEDALDSIIVEKSFTEPLTDGDIVMRKIEQKLGISNGNIQGTVQQKRSKKH